MREWPQVPAQLEKKIDGRSRGKLSHVVEKQTPDARVSEPIVQALSKWVFRPARSTINSWP
jgi:hypothetical protein